MSLIIDMLKDLEKRENGNQVVPPMASSYQQSDPERFDLYKKIAVVSTSIIFVVVIGYYLIHKMSRTTAVNIPTIAASQKSLEQKNSADEAWLSPVTISATSFETNDNSTEISFLLTHNALYRLGHDKNGRILIFVDNAKLESDLPTLIGAEVGVQNITASSVNDNLKFAISLKPGSYLQSAGLTNEGKNPSLVVSIGNAVSAPDEVIASTSNIKTPAMQSIVMDKYHHALKLADMGNKQDAIEALDKLLVYYPDYNDVRVSLAAIILESGNSVKARKIIDDGLSLSPDYLPLIELKARVLTSEGKIGDALMVLQSEQPLITEAPGYHAFIAALYNRENQHKLAADIYQKLVQINPHEGSWWFGLGVSMDKLGHLQDAIYAYSKAATEGRLNAQAMAFLQTRLRVLQEESHVKE